MPVPTGAVVATLLLAGLAPASPTGGHPVPRPCSRLFSIPQFDRAARATYRGTRTPHVGSYGHLWHYAHCQRSPGDERVALRHWERVHDAWELRRHPPLPYGRWAIPASIVMCESRGQNLPPNSAGASGYYQDEPGTWLSFGGGAFASQAYEATKPQQDLVNARIWHVAGPSQWTCASLVRW